MLPRKIANPPTTYSFRGIDICTRIQKSVGNVDATSITFDDRGGSDNILFNHHHKEGGGARIKILKETHNVS